jgi:hypothetical protein
MPTFERLFGIRLLKFEMKVEAAPSQNAGHAKRDARRAVT